MRPKSGMLSTYLMVFGGLFIGLYLGIFVIEYDPQIVAWLFGAGAGLSIGAFIAAITSGVPLAGNPGTGQRYSHIERDDPDDDEDWRDPRDRP